MQIDRTHITIVLDESGSMQPVQDKTISGYNEFLRSQEASAKGDTRVTLVKFNSDLVNTIYCNMPIHEAPDLTRSSYQPRSNTPLYDAIAQAIKDTDDHIKVPGDVLSKMLGEKVELIPLVVFMILTDGQENSSHQYDRKQIFDLIQERKKKGWAFVFLGADSDSWAQAGTVGIAAGAALKTDFNHIDRAFAHASFATSAFTATAHRLAADHSVSNLDSIPTLMAQLRSAGDNFWTPENQDQVTHTTAPPSGPHNKPKQRDQWKS